MMRRATLLVLALVLSACGGELTEIVLVVDTDIADVDVFRIDAVGPDGESRMADADLSAQAAPRRLVLHHKGGALGPVRLTVRGLAGAEERASVQRDVTFEPGESLTLRVFLTACSCAAGETCGNDGACRGATVAPCEYEGRSCSPADAGLRDGGEGDGGPPDAGVDAGPPCEYEATICGVADRLLPSDVITPRPCTSAPGPVTLTVSGPDGAVAGTGDPASYRLDVSGSYTVEAVLDSAGCGPSRAFEVASAVAVPGGSGTLRDLDARVGSAFVAGSDGAFAVDGSRWVDLRGPGVATGDVVPTDTSAVVVVEGEAIFGLLERGGRTEDAVYRVDAAADLSSASHTRIPVGGGRGSVFAMGRRVDGTGPIAIALDAISVLDAPTTAPSLDRRGPSYDADTWITLGTEQTSSLGAVWGGRTDELMNRRLSGGGGTMNDDSSVGLSSLLGAVRDAWVDDRGASEPSLWLCAENAAALYRFSRGTDWTERSSLPRADTFWVGACRDMAIDEPGRVWVVRDRADAVLLEPDATERLRLGPDQGFPATASLSQVATAWDGATREVWFLDASAGVVYLMRADALP